MSGACLALERMAGSLLLIRRLQTKRAIAVFLAILQVTNLIQLLHNLLINTQKLYSKPSQNPNILSFCSGFSPFSPQFRPAFPQFHLLPFPHIVPNSLLPQPKFVLSSLQFLGCKHLFWPFTPFSHIIIILTNRYIEYIDEESKNVFLLGPCRLVGNWLGKIQSFWNKSMPPNNLCHLRPLLLDFSWPAHFWTGIS